MSICSEHYLCGGADFESAINAITVQFHSPSLTITSSPPPLPSLSPPPTSSVDPAASPSPPLRDVGFKNAATVPSQARMNPHPPLPFPKGCGQLMLARWRNQGARRARGTHQVGGPGGVSRNTNHDKRRGSCSFSFSHPPHSSYLKVTPRRNDTTKP